MCAESRDKIRSKLVRIVDLRTLEGARERERKKTDFLGGWVGWEKERRDGPNLSEGVRALGVGRRRSWRKRGQC